MEPVISYAFVPLKCQSVLTPPDVPPCRVEWDGAWEAPAAGEYEFPFHPMAEGDEIHVGELRLRALETPGHTPESVCLVVTDEEKPSNPWAVMTGDTLFIGDVGRPAGGAGELGGIVDRDGDQIVHTEALGGQVGFAGVLHEVRADLGRGGQGQESDDGENPH